MKDTCCICLKKKHVIEYKRRSLNGESFIVKLCKSCDVLKDKDKVKTRGI